MVIKATKPKANKQEKIKRKRYYSDVSKVVNKNLLCTSCNCSVKSMILYGKALLHPFLETLLCDKCSSFYGDGEFSVDEDGSDKYCRWCGQGGTLFLCSKCTAGFCKKCIKRNLPRSVLKDVESSDWHCFCCNVEPLFDLRAQAWAAKQHIFVNTKQGRSRQSNDSDEDYIPKGIRKPKKSKKSADLTFEERACKIATYNTKPVIGEMMSVCNNVERKIEEIKTKHLSRRVMDSLTPETVDIIDQKVSSLFQLFNERMGKCKKKWDKLTENWKGSLEKAKAEDEAKKLENGDSNTEKSKSLGDSDEEDEDLPSSKGKKKVSEDKTSNQKTVKHISESDGISDSEGKIKTKEKSQQNSDEESDDPCNNSKAKSKKKKLDDSDNDSTSKKKLKETTENSDEDPDTVSKKKHNLRKSNSKLGNESGDDQLVK